MGLSTAKVMQLAAMKVKMIKSNQSLDVRSLQNCLVLKSENFMHLPKLPDYYKLQESRDGQLLSILGFPGVSQL